jgi:hypothetical protein
VKFPSELAIQDPGIASSQPAVIVKRAFAKPCHLVHITEHGPALGLGQFNRARVEDAESVEREALGYKLLMYEGHHRYPYRH